MRIVTYNVNGLRSAISKGFWKWLQERQIDVLCLQEIKALPDQIGTFELEELGYHHYWYPAQKKGYSGVALFSKQKPNAVTYGCGIDAYDFEGRIIRADFNEFSVMSVYHPSGSSGDERQAFKMNWLDDFASYIQTFKDSDIIISGDFNICHKPIDIHNPISNAQSSGFLLEERQWLDRFLALGYTDAFRYVNANPHRYSWWSYRAQARQKNLGWRIDYHMVSNTLKHRIKSADMWDQDVHSDHCPVVLDIL